LHVVLVDDGSTDGTADAVKSYFPQVKIIIGDGSLYWNGGTRTAFAEAILEGHEYYMWLNDDTILYSDAIRSLCATANKMRNIIDNDVIVVGSTRGESCGSITYGGLRRESLIRPLGFIIIEPGDEPVQCDSMNGNCVLIPCAIAKACGNLDFAFTHAMGDIDYGLRVRNKGFSIWVMPGYAGVCHRNSLIGSFMDTQLPVKERLRKMADVKGLPFNEWSVFALRHGGIWGPLLVFWPYCKLILTGVIQLSRKWKLG
jgi:GT2 family glycosyltransferase